MSSPRSDRAFWLVTLGMAVAPCVIMVVVWYTWPAPALAAAPPPKPLRAPPPQLVLPVATQGWNAGADYDLIGFDNQFGEHDVPIQVLPPDAAANAARDQAWEPTFRSPHERHYWESMTWLFSHQPPPNAVFVVAELRDCRGTTAVFRAVENMIGEIAPTPAPDLHLKCTREGDRIRLQRLDGCEPNTWVMRPGELLALEGTRERLGTPIYLTPLAGTDVGQLRALVRESVSKPVWPPSERAW